ncbi:hypothetical protein ABB02_00851 [Clostridiaceae bacterium JG1575]|nr:hypothetical protein ABB02_00851 [Clostridiaceae bacterium JG1575]
MNRKSACIGVFILGLFLMGCSPSTSSKDATLAGEKTTKASTTLSLEGVNEFLNSSGDLGEGSIANAVAVIPYRHIDGPKNNSNFYGFVPFKYKARDYIKYQVNYVSCTCRPASSNLWQTLYVELTLPESKKIEDATIRFLSFDKESSGHYLGGSWGDSDPTPAGATYEKIKKEYLSFFPNKTGAYLKSLDTISDIKDDYQKGEGRGAYQLDAFTGSTVSTNNIIRILHAMFDYHATDPHFK